MSCLSLYVSQEDDGVSTGVGGQEEEEEATDTCGPRSS